MKANAETILFENTLKSKQSLTLMYEGPNGDEVVELRKNREKWLEAVEYFTCVDDVNF
jgi:hypothetical protein